MNMTAVIIGVFLTCCVISIFYWQIFRETMLTGIKFRLFARRDDLRRLALDKHEDNSSFAYRATEEFMCKVIAVVPSISLASFVVSMIRNPNPTSEVVDRLRKEASPEVKDLMDKTVRDGLLIMALNSPILVAVAVVFGLLLWTIGKINKMFVYRQAEHFIDELPAETSEPLPQIV